MKRIKISRFTPKSNIHALVTGVLTFLALLLLLFLVGDLLPWVTGTQVWFDDSLTLLTTYNLFTIGLALGLGILWTIYRKPTSKFSIVKKIGLPAFIIASLTSFVSVAGFLGPMAIMGLPLILILGAILGLICGGIYLSIYLIVKDFSQRDINFKIVLTIFLVILLFFPLWNFLIGKSLINTLHIQATIHFRKTYMDTEQINIVKEELDTGGWHRFGWQMGADGVYLYEYLCGCKDDLCVYVEYEPEVGAVKRNLLNFFLFEFNRKTLKLREPDFFTDFEIIPRNIASGLPNFALFNPKDVQPFTNFEDTNNLASVYYFEKIPCDELERFGIIGIKPGMHNEHLWRIYNKESNQTIALIYSGRTKDVPNWGPSKDVEFEAYNSVLIRWQERFKLLS